MEIVRELVPPFGRQVLDERAREEHSHIWGAVDRQIGGSTKHE